MKTFGNKEEFAMSIDFYTDKYKDDEYLQENIAELYCGAEAYFWVKGKNLFAYKEAAPNITYSHYNLYALVDFLSNYLVHHLTESPFPIETQADNGADMVEETLLVKGRVEDELQACMELDWDSIDMELMKKRADWLTYRSLLKNDGSTFLPNIIIRRVQDNIEISWYNDSGPSSEDENEFYMLHTKGVEYVDATLYREVVTQFCFCYIERIKQKNPKTAELYRENLRKAMRAPI